jgi:hypothetical protein
MLKGKHETFLSDNGPIPAAEKMASLAILSWRFHGSPQSSGGHMNLPGLDFQAGESARGRNLLAFEGPDLCTFLLDIQRLLPCSLCFGRCKYRLAEASAAVILQAVIGGTTELFKVLRLGDRVFRFSISSQQDGFHIYSFSAPTSKFTSTYGMGRP